MARALSTGKRLSRLAAKQGLAAFSQDDFYDVGSKVSQDPERLILVGGQALEVWGVVLGVPAPAGDASPLTEDADWLGSQDDARWLANLLGAGKTELQVPEFNDATPNTALMYLEQRTGKVLLMDFLRCVTGIANPDIRANAADLKVPRPGGGDPIQLRVLHPLHCLASRMANLQVHPAKRRGNGPVQAHWAVNIVRAYLTRIAFEASPAQVRGECHKVAKLAQFGAAEYCFTHFQIDPLQAVTNQVLAAGGDEFLAKDWPNTLARVEKNVRVGRQKGTNPDG